MDERTFATRDEFKAWLEEHHATADGVWIKFAKKGSGVQSVALTETLDLALCYGWIDGQRKPLRRDLLPAEVHAAAGALEVVQAQHRAGGEADRGGRDAAAGFAEIERAKGDGRWDAAYDSPANMQVPPDLQAELDARPAAAANFETAQLDQPLLDPLPPARREEARDAGAAAGAVRGDARARRDALLARMRLLVTGGAGYIGSIVAQQLLARGDDVTVLDSLYRGHRAAVPEGAAFVEADLLDAAATAGVLAGGFDGVVHFAALSLVAESVEFPERYWRGNVVGALNLLDAMRARGRAAAGVLLDRRDLRRARRRADHEEDAEPAGQRVRQLEADGRPDARRRGARARAGRGLAALLQRRGRERAAGRGPHARDAPDPAGAAGGGGQRARASRSSAPTTRRRTAPRCATTSTSTTSRRAHLLALEKAVAGRHDIYNLGSARGYSVREVIEAARRGDRARDRGASRRPAGRAIRRGWWPPTRSARAELGWAPGAVARGHGARRLAVAPGAPRRLLSLEQLQQRVGVLVDERRRRCP